MRNKEIVFCNNLQPNTHIRITDREGFEKDYIIRKMIPMQLFKDGTMNPVSDIEILLDKSKNIFFPYDSYLNGKSWAVDIEILS
jgi:hypothetical protein